MFYRWTVENTNTTEEEPEVTVVIHPRRYHALHTAYLNTNSVTRPISQRHRAAWRATQYSRLASFYPLSVNNMDNLKLKRVSESNWRLLTFPVHVIQQDFVARSHWVKLDDVEREAFKDIERKMRFWVGSLSRHVSSLNFCHTMVSHGNHGCIILIHAHPMVQSRSWIH